LDAIPGDLEHPWSQRDVFQIDTEGRLTHEEGLALFDSAKKKLAERGFVHVFVPEHSRKMTQICQLRELETVSAQKIAVFGQRREMRSRPSISCAKPETIEIR
jgi:hypothetical protein